jgi:putative mRNA 3-end processing factor
MRELEIEYGSSGLYLPALDLYLDPHEDVARAFVSHAHGDHARAGGPGALFASRETIALMEARRAPAATGSGSLSGAAAIAWDGAIELPCDGGVARVSIAPAGHVLGAAQLVVDHPGGRFVYTGDYRTGAGATHAAGCPVQCDQLVVESTFALPIFRFPPRDAAVADLVAFCKGELANGTTPVLLAYSLGKSQELVAHLLEANIPVVAHGAAYRVCEAYEKLGVPMGVSDGRLRAYANEVKHEKKRKDATLAAVLITPPRTRGSPMVKKRADAVVAYVSGWALLDAAMEQRRADAGFVVSDHADHVDLMNMVRASGAKRVTTVHGDAVAFATMLASEGIDADALEAPPLDQEEERA